MKKYVCSFLLTIALQPYCYHGAQVGDQEISSKEVAHYGEKLYILDETKSYVDDDSSIDGHRELKSCGNKERVLTVSLITDDYGYETAFTLFGPQGGLIARVPASNQNLRDNKAYTFQYCVDAGKQYKLKIIDKKGDGLCCSNGNGSYKFGIDGTQIYKSAGKGRTFTSSKVHTFNVKAKNQGSSSPSSSGSGSNSNNNSGSGQATSKLTNDGVDRDDAWLFAHNSRRKKYHEQWGKTYTPLKWSPMLASQAKSWANQLLNNCDTVGIKHQSGIDEGENLAANKGTGSNGELKTPDQILNRWVEMELTDGYPANAHLTQALWRASKYVGCADSVKEYQGGYCRYQVCRYATAGNCDMGRYNSATGNNWMKPTLMDESGCGPNCSPEGWC